MNEEHARFVVRGVHHPGDDIDTDERDRDTHLRSADFFDVEKFPDITTRQHAEYHEEQRHLRRDR